MKNSKENIFIPTDSFMIRIPMLTIEDFFKLSSSQNLEELLFSYLENPIVKEAIHIASPNLMNSLKKFNTIQTERKKEQALMSLLKYLLRMSTRATPFGLFSCVGMGKLGDHTSILLSEVDSVKKRARPDMEWLNSIIEEAEKNIPLIQRCKVVANPLCYHSANRLVLDYSDHAHSTQKDISIRRSFLTDFIVKEAKNPLLYSRLEENICEHFPNLDREKIKNLIWTLFSKKFLISELNPSLLISEPFEDLSIF